MAHLAPPANVPNDPLWFVTLGVIGVVLGSAMSLATQGGFFRNIFIGMFGMIGLGLVFEWAGISLPFEPWLKSFAASCLNAIIRLFAGMVQR